MKTFIVILVLLLIIGGAYLVWGRADEVEIKNVDTNVPTQNSTSTPPTATSTPSTASTSTPSYTIAQVATHNKSTDCWVAVNGNVYNLTSWIARHPGGQQAILGICGKDATVTFENQHDGQPKPEAMLSTFLIGKIK